MSGQGRRPTFNSQSIIFFQAYLIVWLRPACAWLSSCSVSWRIFVIYSALFQTKIPPIIFHILRPSLIWLRLLRTSMCYLRSQSSQLYFLTCCEQSDLSLLQVWMRAALFSSSMINKKSNQVISGRRLIQQMGNCFQLNGEIKHNNLHQNQLVDVLQLDQALHQHPDIKKQSVLAANCRHNHHNDDTKVTFSSKSFVRHKSCVFKEDYQVSKIIGKGAFGQVFEATCKRTGQIRAVKKIFRKQAQQLTPKQYDILKDVDHPNIVRLIDFYEQNQTVYLVTELGVGDFFQILKEVKNISEQNIRQIMKGLLSALNYLHSNNIVHRDIKLQNLILMKKGDFSSIKLIDFGTCIISKEKMKKMIGTLYYIAPEVLRNQYTTKCDIWSAGVVLYVLFTGKPPFCYLNQNVLIQSILNKQVNFNQLCWQYISEEGKDLVQKMLNKNPDKRISAQWALNHPWFNTQRLNIQGIPNIVKDLNKLNARSKFKSLLISFITTRIMEQQGQESKANVFKDMDLDKDGRISKEEFIRYVSTNQQNLQVFKKIDSDNSGYIEYSEILAALQNQHTISKYYLVRAFLYMDSDGDGILTSSQLKEVLCPNIQFQLWNQMLIQQMGEHKNELTMYEFMKLFQADQVI